MTLRPSILILALVGLLSVPILASAGRLNSVRSQLQTAKTNFDQTVRDSQRIVELRAKHQTIAEQKRPDQDIIARVSGVLAESGIPTDRFGGLRPESDTAMPTTGQSRSLYRKQSVRITLNDLSIPQVGEFLSRWHASQPLWVPNRIELTHAREKANEGRYSLNLLLTAIYVGQEGSS